MLQITPLLLKTVFILHLIIVVYQKLFAFLIFVCVERTIIVLQICSMSSHICLRISTLLRTRVISAGESESLLTSHYVFELFVNKNEILYGLIFQFD